MSREWSNASVFVTGSSRRLGREIAIGFAERGANIVMHHRRSDDEYAINTTNYLRSLGVQVLDVFGDVCDVKAMERAFDQIRDTPGFGRLDVLVNNASSYIHSGQDHAIRSSIDTNFVAPYHISEMANQLMRLHDGGSIVNILDLSAFKPRKFYAEHSASKAALGGLTHALAIKYAPRVRVNSVTLGYILRDDGMEDDEWQALSSRVPMERPGNTTDAVQAIMYLAGAGYVVGTNLFVDGGMHLR